MSRLDDLSTDQVKQAQELSTLFGEITQQTGVSFHVFIAALEASLEVALATERVLLEAHKRETSNLTILKETLNGLHD